MYSVLKPKTRNYHSIASSSMATPLCLQQVHLGPGPAGYLPIDSLSSPNKSDYSQDHAAYEGFLTRDCPASVWPQESYMRSCPRPMLLNRKHHAKLVELHGALSKAILDIVPRWWSDRDAGFPSRMPLEPDEERLLQVRHPLFPLAPRV